MASSDASRADLPARGLGRRVTDMWLDWRDRLLASPRFHRIAAAFPLSRPLARRRARELFDLCAGFVYSQVLLACVRTGAFDALADGPRSAAALAPRLGLSPEAADRLMVAAASLRLAERRGVGADGAPLFGLGELGGALRAAPGVVEMIEHHALLYADLSDPVALLRRGSDGAALGAYWTYADCDRPAELSAEQVATYSALMAASQPFVAEEALDAYRVARHRRVLDVGGGEGAFLKAVAARAPALRMTLFDLPAVAERARSALTEAGLGARVDIVGGSFFDDPLPRGADLVTLVRVLYDHDDDAVLTILRAVRAACPPDGTVLVVEPMADTPGAAPIGDAYFNFYLLAMGGGRARTPDALIGLLRAAGFADARLLPTRRPLLARAIVARPGRVGSGSDRANM